MWENKRSQGINIEAARVASWVNQAADFEEEKFILCVI